MQLQSEGKQIRVYIGEQDKYEKMPLYEAITRKAKERGMAGCTVFRAMMGFGANSRVHTAGILRLSADLPIVIVIVDNPERIEAFLPELEEMVNTGGLITVEDMNIVMYRPSS